MRKHSTFSLRRRSVAAIALALLFTACGPSRDGLADSASAGMASNAERVDAIRANGAAEVQATATSLSPPSDASAASLGGGSLPPATDPTGAMLIRHGQASVEVRRVEDAVAQMRQTAAQFGGFVANTALRTGREEQRSATLELRVPTGQFDALLGALGTLGKVESITANAQDVGDEYVDLGARAANARRLEARLVEMVATRTGKLSDLLTVEQELARVRTEIERYDARLRWLERRTALSSLDITLHEPLPLIDRPRAGPLVEALGVAWDRTMGVIGWCIAALGLIVPLGVLIGAIVLVMKRIRWHIRPT